jgi:GH15 family glucan-1,4-alpha-glucosidase
MTSIEDHALIGDCRSAALVGVDGTMDWLCWPLFDSPPLFGALLDRGAGSWRVHPTAPFRSRQRYVSHSNVLQTRFEVDTGSAVLTDLMPVASDERKRRHLVPEHEILRLVRCQSGEVTFEVAMEVQPAFGEGKVRSRASSQFGVRAETDQGVLLLSSNHPLRLTPDGVARGEARLRAGEELQLSLTFASEEIAVLPVLGDRCGEAVAVTNDWWRSWLRQLHYEGPQRGAVERSALLLKLLVFAPSGAILAAPTTSLPERIGGDLNWDYRFCWLRDAALTVRALFGLGFRAEAQAFASWLLHSTRLTQPRLRVLYDVHGNVPPDERILPHLTGFRGSRPVRLGNAAEHQLQLDVYGEVIDAVARAVWEGNRIDGETESMLEAFGSYVCHHWPEPDEGIWEPRSGRRHNTHSRVLCWVALDRLLELKRAGHLHRISEERFAKNRAMIREEVTRRAWNERLGSYVATLDGDDVDANLLLLAWYGFEPPTSPRMKATYATIQRRLGAGGPLLYRYSAPPSHEEGAFGICSFWGVEYLALGGGSVEEALAGFDELCDRANETGLYAEEFDPASGAALGNFPQAFTHVGLINAALSLSQRLIGRVPPTGERA